MTRFPEFIDNAYKSLEPQIVAIYLQQLATHFHKFYGECRVINDNHKITQARLNLVKAVKVVLGNGFNILGISAPENVMIDFIQSELQFFALCLTTLFTLTNPIGIAPLLLKDERFTEKEKINIAKKGSFTAFFTLILFSLLGSLIFTFFGITIEAFQIMGGILF